MQLKVYTIQLPLQQTFSHAKKARQCSESILIVIEALGKIGLGEAAPRAYVTGEGVDEIYDGLRHLNVVSFCKHLDLSSVRTAIDSFDDYEPLKQLSPNAYCMLEMAYWDWLGKYFGLPLWKLISTVYQNKLLLNVDLKRSMKTTQVLDLALSPEDFIKNYAPFHTIKLKVTNDINENVLRLKALRNQVGNEIPLMIDANMAWTYEEALRQIDAFSPCNVSVYEEPLKPGSWHDYANLKKESGVKIMLDESLCTMSDAKAAVQHKACDVFNIRLAKCGGLSRALSLIQFAKENNIEFQLGAQVAETGPLIAAQRHLAAVIPGYLTLEAGQADRWFADAALFDPMPAINRETNMAFLPEGDGLGINLISSFENKLKPNLQWQRGVWQS